MKVLYFHQYFSTPSAAGGIRSYKMARKLIARGHQVTMVCGRSEIGTLQLQGRYRGSMYKGSVDGIQVIHFNLQYSNYMSLNKRTWVFLQYALKSAMLALRMDFDLVFATSTPLTASIPGIVARYLRGKPFVFEIRDLWPELPRAMRIVKNRVVLACLSYLEWLSYKAASACIALAPGIKEGVSSRSPKGRRIAMIPNGCDLEIFRPGKREKLDLPGIARHDCVSVFIGAHGIANGLDAVLDAAHALQQRGRKDIILLFIGDGKLKPQLLKRVRSEGLENCRFFNPMPKNKLNSIVSCCNIGLMILDDVPAFYFGTSPNKFFDYISSGIPVIINYPGWLADIAREHRCGIVLPPKNPDAFADALIELADHPDLQNEYGKNARYLAEKCFSRDKFANEFVDFLEDVYSDWK